MEFVDLKKQYELNGPLIENRIKAVLEHGKFIMGPEVRELEQRLASYVGCKFCISCSSGTDALLMSLMAYGVGPGDAVFTTPFTFMATAEVISFLGAVPVFVDIDRNTFNIDPCELDKAVEKVLTGKSPARGISQELEPMAVIAVDLFGLPADYALINQVAKDHNLVVLEDAAQSFGATCNGQNAGALADIAATSFFPAKPLGCYGDGGAIFTDNEECAGRIRSLREHGKGSEKYDNVQIGINGRLDTIQAAVLLAKLDFFDNELHARRLIARYYSNALRDSFVAPHTPEGFESAWAQYSLLAEPRESHMERLKSAGIPSCIYYPRPLHLQKAFSYLGYMLGDFTVAEEISGKIFSLPMHPYLGREEQDMVIKILNQIC